MEFVMDGLLSRLASRGRRRLQARRAGQARSAFAEGLEPRRLLAWTQVYDYYNHPNSGFSDGGVNGVVAFATPDDGAGSDKGIVVTLSNVPAHTLVDASAILGHANDDSDGSTPTLTADGETVSEVYNGPGGGYETILGGTVASRGDAGGTVVINVSIEDFQGTGWGLRGLYVSVFTPTVSISGGGGIVNERNQSVVPVTVSRDGGPASWSGPLSVPIEWGGDATRDKDYAGAIDQVTIPAGEGSTTVYVTVLDDENYEPQETFTAKIAGGGSDFVVGSNAPIVTTILESDRVSGVNVEGETYTVGDVKEVKVLVTDEDGYGKGGETVTLSSADAEVVRPQTTTATTDENGYAHFDVLGYGAGVANLIATVMQVGATQPTTAQAQQSVAIHSEIRSWPALKFDSFKDVRVKLLDQLEKAIAQDTKDRSAVIAKGIDFIDGKLAQMTRATIEIADTVVEDKVDHWIFFDDSSPDIRLLPKEIEVADTGLKVTLSIPKAMRNPDQTTKIFIIKADVTIDLSPEVLGTKIGVHIAGDLPYINGQIVAKDGKKIVGSN